MEEPSSSNATHASPSAADTTGASNVDFYAPVVGGTDGLYGAREHGHDYVQVDEKDAEIQKLREQRNAAFNAARLLSSIALPSPPTLKTLYHGERGGVYYLNADHQPIYLNAKQKERAIQGVLPNAYFGPNSRLQNAIRHETKNVERRYGTGNAAAMHSYHKEKHMDLECSGLQKEWQYHWNDGILGHVVAEICMPQIYTIVILNHVLFYGIHIVRYDPVRSRWTCEKYSNHIFRKEALKRAMALAESLSI